MRLISDVANEEDAAGHLADVTRPRVQAFLGVEIQGGVGLTAYEILPPSLSGRILRDALMLTLPNACVDVAMSKHRASVATKGRGRSFAQVHDGAMYSEICYLGGVEDSAEFRPPSQPGKELWARRLGH